MNLEQLRKQIDQIDTELVVLLEQRFNLTEQVGTYKRQHNLPTLNVEREQLVLQNIQKRVTHQPFIPYILPLWQAMMDLSKQQQLDGSRNEDETL